MAISWKQWEIPPRVLLITNRKWHMPFQIKWKSLTSDDPEGHWQPVQSAILATAGLLVIKCHLSCDKDKMTTVVILWLRQFVHDVHLCHSSLISSTFGQRKTFPDLFKNLPVMFERSVILAYCLFNIVFCSFLPGSCTMTQSVNFTPRLQTVRIRKC